MLVYQIFTQCSVVVFQLLIRIINELIFFYTLFIVELVTGVSLITNPLIGLDASATCFSWATFFFIPFIFWLARHKKKFALARNSFIVFSVLMINGVWLTSGGSGGTILIMVQGFMFLYVFFSNERYYQWFMLLLALNLIVLFGIELYYPSMITQYESPEFRTLDVFLVTFIFLGFELPVLIFAKRSIMRDRQEAVTSEAAKTSFVVNLSHEIRTPMNAILGFAELLEDPALEREQQQQFIKVINDNGRNLLILLNNVISFSKIESNQTEVTVADISLRSVFEQVFASIGLQIREKPDVKVSLSLPEEDVVMRTDSLKVYQILMNMSYNALKYTQSGSVEIGYIDENESVLLFVKDTGIGIPLEAKDEIFERFVQAGDTLKSHTLSGAGLGLAICKGLTLALKGKIWVDSELGKGSRFYVRLPKINS